MSRSPQTVITVDEEIPLNAIPGSGEMPNNDTSNQVISSGAESATCCCIGRHYRNLAIWSIICGLSCIGIKALTESVKAEMTTDPDTAKKRSLRARKFGIISIITWVSILVMVPLLVVLISYLITLQD